MAEVNGWEVPRVESSLRSEMIRRENGAMRSTRARRVVNCTVQISNVRHSHQLMVTVFELLALPFSKLGGVRAPAPCEWPLSPVSIDPSEVHSVNGGCAVVWKSYFAPAGFVSGPRSVQKVEKPRVGAKLRKVQLATKGEVLYKGTFAHTQCAVVTRHSPPTCNLTLIAAHPARRRPTENHSRRKLSYILPKHILHLPCY